jgi:hypothetical protein
MALRRLLETAAAASALTLATLASPVLAHDGPTMGHYGPAQHYSPGAEMRDGWLAECRQRLSGPYDPRDAAERCEDIFDDYYEYYRQQGPGPAHGYPAVHKMQSGMVSAGGCCQRPMRSHGEPRCTETVEYEYVDVPVRAAPKPRPAPPKRVKVVPDKRVYIK